MNAKWYVSALFLIFTLFGALQEQVLLPNQEIVLEFVDAKIDRNNIEVTIADIKEKLQNLDVSSIIIKETKNGTLKISYYSSVNVDNIKDALAKDTKIVLNKNSENKQKNSNSSDYKIHVYELANSKDSTKSDDKLIFEINPHSDRFTANNYFVVLKKLQQDRIDLLFKIRFNINKNIPFTKDRTSYKEPEVRAGPQFHFI